MRVQTLSWCTGIDLCIPMERVTITKRVHLVLLTKAMLKRETTLGEAFPSYQYGLMDWVAERVDREKDRETEDVNS